MDHAGRPGDVLCLPVYLSHQIDNLGDGVVDACKAGFGSLAAGDAIFDRGHEYVAFPGQRVHCHTNFVDRDARILRKFFHFSRHHCEGSPGISCSLRFNCRV